MRSAVVIPTFNRPNDLEKTVSYIRPLLGPKLQLVVVDDASTDPLQHDVLGRLEAESRWITIRRLRHRHGCTRARMAGLDLLEGTYAILLDDDSYPAEPQSDFVQAIEERFDNDSALALQAFPVVVPAKGETVTGSVKRCGDGLLASCFTNCACALRLEAYRAVGGYRCEFDSPYGEESDLAMRLLQHGWLIRQYRDPVVIHQESAVSRDCETVVRARTSNTLRFIWWYFPVWLAVLFSANVLWNRLRTSLRKLNSPRPALLGVLDFISDVRRGFTRTPVRVDAVKAFFGLRFNRISSERELSVLRSRSWRGLVADYLSSRRRRNGEPAGDGLEIRPRPVPAIVPPSRTPLVSVIVPAYNAERHLETALESASAQTYRRLDIVVVDDGSQDATAEIASAFAAGDSRVRLIRQKNAGVAAARNRALGEARGECVAPLDADDVWYPEKIERQVEALREAGPSTGLVAAGWDCIDEHGRIIPGSRRSPTSPEAVPNGRHVMRDGVATEVEAGAGARRELVHALPHGNGISDILVYRNVIACASAPLIRASCFEQVGGYNTRMFRYGGQGCEDWDLYLRIAEHYRFASVPECLLAYRTRRDSMSKQSAGMAASYEIMMAELERRRPDLPPQLLRHGRQRFYWYLSNLCGRNGDRLGAAAWLTKAILADPSVVGRIQAGRAVRRVTRVFRSNGVEGPADTPAVPTTPLTARAAEG